MSGRPKRLKQCVLSPQPQGYFTADISGKTAPGWVFALTGIINVLVSMNKDARSAPKPENAKQYDVLRSAYPRIEATLWKLHTTASSDKLVDVLALGMFHIFRVPELHR